MSIETNRILGGVGALLMFLGVLPGINHYCIVELAGLILVMIATYNFSSYYREARIFNNALYGLITIIVGGVTSVGAIVVTILSALADFLHAIFTDWNGEWTALSGLTPNPSSLSLGNILPFVAGIFAVFIILWASSMIAAFFARRSLLLLSDRSGIRLFSTTGFSKCARFAIALSPRTQG